jgi:hypothetical protein
MAGAGCACPAGRRIGPAVVLGMWRAWGAVALGGGVSGPPPGSLSPGEAARAVKWLVEHSLIDTAAGSAVVCYSDPDLP